MEILVGIDLGTTVLKAAALDARTGAVLGQTSIRLQVDSTPGGAREQDPSAIDAAFADTILHLRRRLGRRWRCVCGIGLAAQGGSTIIARRDTGRPLTRMVLWNDSRTLPLLSQIAASKPLAYWRKFSLRDQPGAGLARLVWLRQKRPRLLRPTNIYIGAGEYLHFRMTGLWRQDAGNALQIGCYNVPRRDLDQRPLDLVGANVSFFAPMRRGHEVHPLSKGAAKRLGLSTDVLVAGPYMDHEAGYLSATGSSRRPLQCSLGTAWVGNFILPEITGGRSPIQLVLPAPVGDGRLVVQPLLTGNVTWDWALKTLVHADHEKALERVDRVFGDELLPPCGLASLPWLARPNPLDGEAMGGGAFLGVGPHTTSAEMLRAVAAGMCCEMSRVLEEVKSSGEVDTVVLSGGASRGRFFRATLASLFWPLPVRSVSEEDLAGVRGAVFAFSRKAAAARTLRVRLPPRAVRRGVARGYDLYRRLFDRLYGHEAIGKAFHFGR